MALITYKSVVLLLVLGFVQVLHSHARQNEFVFRPRGHLDSGQEPSSASSEFLSLADEFPSSGLENSGPDDPEWMKETLELHPIRELIQESEEQSETEQGEIDEEDEFRYDDFDVYYGDEDDPIFTTSEENSIYLSQVPLKRIRRRIIPVGKTIDRGRSDGGGTYGRSRSPWAQPPRNKDPVVTRTGPTGSAALFSLYPELAPPEWKAKKGAPNSKKKKSNHTERDTESIKERSKPKQEEASPQSDEGTGPAAAQVPKKKVQRRKSKLSKRMKEEIAKFAELHGVERAVTHFKSRVNAPLREESVEKFLRRYKNRMQRKASRS